MEATLLNNSIVNIDSNVEAFTTYYQFVYKDLYRFAFYTLKNKFDAEDVVSEAVIDAFVGIKNLRDKSAIKAWLFKILSRKCKQKLKQYSNKNYPLNEDIIYHNDDYDEVSDLKIAFNTLSDEEKLIVSLSVFGGYESKEIGNFLNLNHNTVRSKLSRSLEKMSNYLK